MAAKVFLTLKWATLVAAVLFMAILSGELYTGFYEGKEYDSDCRIGLLAGFISMIISILISIRSIKMDTRFWNSCLWALPALLVFNIINVDKAMVKNKVGRFESFICETLRFEGGYVDDPFDRGGKTNWGISWHTWRAAAGKYLKQEPTAENLRNLSVKDAKKIYRGEYWDKVGADKIKCPRVAYMIFDWNITSYQARKKIQMMLNEKYNAGLDADGHFGGKTIRTINRIEDQHRLLLDIADARKKHYENIARRNPSQKRFKKGWINRVDECVVKFRDSSFEQEARDKAEQEH